MSRTHVADRRRAFIHPFLPPSARTGQPRAQDRRAIKGVIAGLARATERDASDILRGGASIVPEVMGRFDERKRAAGFW